MDSPNLFPALTPEDRERLAAIAGSLESLPAILDRLAGYVADPSKARPTLPSIVLPMGPPQPWNPMEAAPLTVDGRGYQRIRVRRDARYLGALVIKSGQQDGVPLVNPILSGAVTWEDIGGSCPVYDDPTRTESVQVQAFMEKSAAWTLLSAPALFSGAFGSVQGQQLVSVSTFLGSTAIRMRAAAPVAADRTFHVYAFGA